MLKVTTNVHAEPLRVVVIGGGLAGLACSIGLRRSGHKVTVLEKDAVLESPPGGVRIPPNATNILKDWGYKDQLETTSKSMNVFNIIDFETGKSLLHEIWDSIGGTHQVIEKFSQEFRYTSHSACRKLLYDIATELGVEVRLGSPIVDCDLEKITVTTELGEVVEGDFMVGADGSGGFSRRQFGTESKPKGPVLFNLYNAVTPRKVVSDDDSLKDFIEQNAFWGWCGDTHTSSGFFMGEDGDFATHTYTPFDGTEGDWTSESHPKWDHVEPRLKKILEGATSTKCITIRDYEHLDEWVHESGNLVLVGEAAHPLIPCSMQAFGMAIEDAAVLGKLFAHTKSKDKITSLLWAFQDLQQPRYERITTQEFTLIKTMMFPPGEDRQKRDDLLSTKAGNASAVHITHDGHGWAGYQELLGYDAEGEAENWLTEWERIRELDGSLSSPVDDYFNVRVTKSSHRSSWPGSGHPSPAGTPTRRRNEV
ncbi:hypothetical protein HGRIS_001007 [Hohenbuehelia grisea]|uniref:FAD-binding domain-containing protein n=1 Tax=Hohenbuehelia grisea TaxID=104357 RepID=A0ABR3IQH4_9AGAR